MDCEARLVGMLDAADPGDLLQALQQVRSRLESEVQFMHIFGARGGHVRLLRLTDHADDGVREVAAEAVALCAEQCMLTGCAFPMKATVSEPLPIITVDVGKGIVLRLQAHADRPRCIANMLWAASAVLARKIVAEAHLFAGRSIVEIGAGLGLAGLAAARIGAHVLLTEQTQGLANTLQANIRLNDIAAPGGSGSGSAAAAAFDWDMPADADCAAFAPDIVIGTDLVGDLPHAPGVVRALLHWLRPGGTALMVNAIDTHRFGIPRLKELLREERALRSEWRVLDRVADSALFAADDEHVPHTYELYEITRL